MKKCLALAGAITVMTAAMPALADDHSSSWYVGGSGGVTMPRNSTITGTSTGKVDYGFSSGGDLAFGYKPEALNFSAGDVRAEIEGGYHALGLKKVVIGGVPNTNPKGDMKIMTVMANAYYDVHTSTPFTPYIGGGIGEAMLNFPKNNGFGNTKSGDNQLAYQFMTGVSYTPESMPSTDWSLGYRYLGSSAPQFTTAGGHVSSDALSTHSVELGFRYKF